MPMKILNGDHAEFERENMFTKPEDRPDWPLPSFDAQDWAKAFVKLHGGDEGLMLAWFANALMRGFDEHARRSSLLKPATRATAPDMTTPEGVAKSRANADFYRNVLKPFA